MTHDEKLERLVVGMVLSVGATDGVEQAKQLLDSSGLRPSHFGSALCRDVWGAISALLAWSPPRPITSASVASVASLSTMLQEAGGEKAVGLLRLEAYSEPRESLTQHAETLKALAVKRELQRFLHETSARARQGSTNAAELLADVRKFCDATTAAVQRTQDCREDIFAFNTEIELALTTDAPDPLIPTGIRALDAEITGLRPTLTVIGGLPGVGKSAIIATILGNLASQGVKCGLFGLEDGTSWVTKRLVARESEIPVGAFSQPRLLSRNQYAAFQVGMNRVHGFMGNVLKSEAIGRMRPADLVAQAKDWIVNKGVRVVFVDHLGELQHGGSRERFDLSVADSLSQLRSIATEHRAAVVVVAHLRRDADRRLTKGEDEEAGRPLLSQFAESAYIERMARLALGIWPCVNDDRYVNVSVLKHTFGPPGATVKLWRLPKAALVANDGGGRLELRNGGRP